MDLILTAIAVLLAIKAWRNSSWFQLFSVVGFLCCHCLNRKGQDILSGQLVPTTLWYRFRTLSMTDERLYD